MELRNYWKYHPKYKDIVDKIQGKYSFKERPTYGIIVKTGSGTKVDLAADNFVGTVNSYIFLTKIPKYNGTAIEWVREDSLAIEKNRGAFPSPPGIYYVDITGEKEFWVDCLLDVRREQVMMTDTTHGSLMNPPLNGTIRIYEMPSGFLLYENINYTLVLNSLGKPTGEIVLTAPLTGGRVLSADYRYPGPSKGPFPLYPNNANNMAIPGCVLAFGNRIEKGDRMAVVVQNIRQPSALEYGGRWGITLDVDVVAQDADAQQEIADQTVIYLWGVLRSYLSSEGIEMTELSMGGESEEVRDETGDDYTYNSSFSMTLETNWSVHVPLGLFIRQVSPLTVKESKIIAALPDDQVAAIQNNLRMVENIGLEVVMDPFFSGRNSTFEVIR